MANTLFLTLRTFSATGGIEKVCRVMGKALLEIANHNKESLQVISMYDETADAAGNVYLPAGIFRGFGKSKLACSAYAVKTGVKTNLVILSHVNLLAIGWVIKKLSPSTKLVLLVHGIEIWSPLSSFKKKMLQTCDQVIAVSEYTRQQVMAIQGFSPAKCTVINNCLDPFLPLPAEQSDAEALRKKYGLSESDLVLFCLTRLAATERHKGYDKVIRCLPALQQQFDQRIVYVIAGKYTDAEAAFIQETAAAAGIAKDVMLTGYVPDDALAALFKMADLYVMPSSKEGFGIVFIEAMFYGLTVIAGNKDGSVDALANGEFGLLVDPADETAIKLAVYELLSNKEKYLPNRLRLSEKFGFDAYRKRWGDALSGGVPG